MQHLAILKKNWKLLGKIISGKKTIESRWYHTKRAPWGKIAEGDTIYFKNSGEPVTVKATAGKVMQLEINPEKAKEILETYGKEIGLENINASYERNKDKRYCILVFLKDVQKVEPFNIDKTGHGLMSAWISIEDIKQITRK